MMTTEEQDQIACYMEKGTFGHLRKLPSRTSLPSPHRLIQDATLHFYVIFLFWACLLYHQIQLTHSHTMTPFDVPGKQAIENTVGKGEIARKEQFLLFPQCFLPI